MGGRVGQYILLNLERNKEYSGVFLQGMGCLRKQWGNVHVRKQEGRTANIQYKEINGSRRSSV